MIKWRYFLMKWLIILTTFFSLSLFAQNPLPHDDDPPPFVPPLPPPPAALDGAKSGQVLPLNPHLSTESLIYVIVGVGRDEEDKF